MIMVIVPIALRKVGSMKIDLAVGHIRELQCDILPSRLGWKGSGKGKAIFSDKEFCILLRIDNKDVTHGEEWQLTAVAVGNSL